MQLYGKSALSSESEIFASVETMSGVTVIYYILLPGAVVCMVPHCLFLCFFFAGKFRDHSAKPH